MTELRQNGAPAPTDVATRDTSYDSAWNTWMNSWLDNERAVMIPWFEKMVVEFCDELLDLIRPQLKKIGAVELKLAELRGAVDILRGAAPPPPAKFPKVEAWEDGGVYHEGDVVAFAGATYQARRDTAKTPGSADWTCVATAGRSVNICGTYDSSSEYNLFDVVACGGSSFIALKDSPGPCPSSGDWQLLAGRGSRGPAGSRGERGFAGPRGERGQAAPTICAWEVDRASYAATAIMSDGSKGPPLELRLLFEQFVSEQG